jgi:hypothetical protein
MRAHPLGTLSTERIAMHLRAGGQRALSRLPEWLECVDIERRGPSANESGIILEILRIKYLKNISPL